MLVNDNRRIPVPPSLLSKFLANGGPPELGVFGL
jgi:hypothetical protein